MPRLRAKGEFACKSCGSKFPSQKEIEVIKVWHTFSPFPDKNGNITINVFASWRCPLCGAKNKSRVSSIKSGAEYKGKNYTELLEKIIHELKETTIEELSKRINMPEDVVFKALRYLIAEGKIKARLNGKKVIAL